MVIFDAGKEFTQFLPKTTEVWKYWTGSPRVLVTAHPASLNQQYFVFDHTAHPHGCVINVQTAHCLRYIILI